jgi:hypothetical protein
MLMEWLSVPVAVNLPTPTGSVAAIATPKLGLLMAMRCSLLKKRGQLAAREIEIGR